MKTPDHLQDALAHPSSVSASPSHLLPQGEKALTEKSVWKPSAPNPAVGIPSPLAGEGARRACPGPDPGADEGKPATPPQRLLKTSQRTKHLARSLRRNATAAEGKLWQLLRHRRLEGFKFRRQVPIGPYVADFACLSAQLVIELDGSQHFDSPHDARRDAWLVAGGYRVLRVWNSELNENPSGVLEAIWHAIEEHRP